MLVEKVKVDRDQSERCVLVRSLLQLLKHRFKQACEKVSTRFFHVLKLRGTLKLTFDLKVHVAIESAKCVTLQDHVFHELSFQSLLLIIEHILCRNATIGVNTCVILVRRVFIGLVCVLLVVFGDCTVQLDLRVVKLSYVLHVTIIINVNVVSDQLIVLVACLQTIYSWAYTLPAKSHLAFCI